jgi:hypothetical protein
MVAGSPSSSTRSDTASSCGVSKARPSPSTASTVPSDSTSLRTRSQQARPARSVEASDTSPTTAHTDSPTPTPTSPATWTWRKPPTLPRPSEPPHQVSSPLVATATPSTTPLASATPRQTTSTASSARQRDTPHGAVLSTSPPGFLCPDQRPSSHPTPAHSPSSLSRRDCPSHGPT